RVHFVKLFNLLIKRGMCPLSVLLLMFVYTHQSMKVKWNVYITEGFNCFNGVKQGCVLSPILFCIYVDEL
ncbi:hypothetical protein CAPTEDRAFT_70193, partial [Capitella teleta]